MNKRFTEDGWRFDVSYRQMISGDECIVKFYYDNLSNPQPEDIYGAQVTNPKELTIRNSE